MMNKKWISSSVMNSFFTLLLLMLLSNSAWSATFNFNTLYKGTGNTYDQNSQSIVSLVSVQGSGFQFYQAGPTFSGNSINGVLSYTNNNGTLVTLYGNLNRRNKNGSVSNAFYFTEYTDANYTTATGYSYLLVIPGKESLFSAGVDVSTSSDPIDNALNAVVAAMPVTTLSVSSLSAFTACPSTASAAQSFTLTASNLSANVTVSAPTGFLVSSTQNGTYSSTLTIAPTSGSLSSGTGAISNGIVWAELYNTNSGTYSGSISVSTTNAGTQYVSVTGTVASVTGGTISGSTTVTSGTNSTTLTLSGYTGTIQWQSSTNNISYSDITGATTSTYLATNVTATTYYRAVITNNACTANSDIATITFDNGCYSFDVNDFQLNGTATNMNNGIIRLTQATGNQNGSIWNRNKVNLDNDFDISTKINLGSSNSGADGIAFVLQNQAVNAGSTGGGLGYMGITPSFAVEFDTYNNGSSSDPQPVSGSDDHIAIVKNGLAAVASEHSRYANPYFVEMEDGLWHDVRFVWNATTHHFQVYWNGSNTTLFDVVVDLKSTIFNGQSNVYFGLTAATGGAMNLQQVQVPTYCLVKQVSITPKPGLNNSTAATSICAPATVVLEASTNASYLWYKDGVAMPDSTTQSIIVSTSGVYKVDGVNYQGVTTTSDNVTVTVNQNADAGTITSTSSNVCSNVNSTGISLTGYTGTIQWQSSTNGTSFTNITGATSATYTATNLTSTRYYRAYVSSGSCTTATSGTITITYTQPSVAGTISGGGVSVCSGTANSTTLTLSGYTGTIQWQSSTDNTTFTDITGATNATYTATNVTATTYYRVVVTNGLCNAATSASSVSITVSQCIVANPDINATNVNTQVSGNVSTNDKITTGTTYGTPTPATTNPTGGVLVLNSDGTYTFTSPNPGKYVYYVPVCAQGQTTGCAVATLEISVTDPNSTTNPPLAKNDYTTSQVNTPVTVKVLSNDKVANSNTSLVPSTVAVVNAPSNGTASVNTTTGVITFTPNTGFTGTDSLNYNVCDNASPANCQIATVYIKVTSTAVAEYTTADDDFNKIDMKTVATGNVLTNDVNSAGNALTVTAYGTPLTTQGTIVINADGSYTFTPTATFYGPVDITYTACTSGNVCADATLHILVSPVKPAAPTVTNKTYTSKASTNPTTISPSVTNVPSGSKAIYCDVNGLNCSTTTPVLPTQPGIYIWCIKSQDTITLLTSDPCVYDTITILPYVKTINATYVKGVATNPKNIAGLVTEISSGSKPQWCDPSGNNCTTTAPSVPTTVGRYIWCVKAIDTASGLSSASCVMDTVTILDPYTVLEISKKAKSVKLNPDGSILTTFVLSATNKTDASIDNVTIKDDLASAFNTTSGILISSIDVSGGLIKNTGYDGVANIDLVATGSKIAAKTTDSVVLKVLLENTDVSGPKTNVATLSGKTKYGTVSVQSNDPLANPSDSTKRVPTSFVVPTVGLVIAGGFSPNQDGYNDKWIIVRPFGTIIHVKVFNRWGNIVYENENYNNDWDGRGQGNFIGDYVPEGTYFYIVEATDRNGSVQRFTKSLTIVR